MKSRNSTARDSGRSKVLRLTRMKSFLSSGLYCNAASAGEDRSRIPIVQSITEGGASGLHVADSACQFFC